MRLIETELHNIGIHRELAHRWHPSLNIVVGANGSGKSTAVCAIQAALTNDFSIFPGNKIDNAAQLAAGGDPSRIVVRLSHGDYSLEIQRGIRGARSVLIAGDSAPVVGDVRINQELTRLVGISPPVLSELVFIPQRRMYEMLVAKPADRAAIFSDLFNLGAAERAYALLGKELAACPVYRASGEGELVERRLGEASARLASLRAEAAGLAADPAAEAAARSVIEADTRHRECLRRRADAADRLARCRAEMAELDGVIAAMAADRDTFAGAAAALSADADAAKAELEAWGRWRQQERVRRSLDEQWRQLEGEEAALVAPAPPPVDATADAAEYERSGASLRADLQAAAKLAAAARTGSPCPVCATPAVDLMGRCEESERARPAMQAELDRLVRASQLVGEHRAKETAYRHALDSLARRRAQLEATSRTFQATAAPARAEEECRAVIAEAGQFRAAADDAAARQVAAVGRRRMLDELAGRLAGPDDDGGPPVPPGDLERARGVLASQAGLAAAAGRAQGQIDELEMAIARDAASLARLRGEEAEAARRNRWREHVEALREVVHPGGVARMVTQEHLARIEDGLNDLLASFEAKFRVETTDELSYLAVFSDGRRQPATRLSCGEKVLLALAFRISCNALFAGDLGLLVLDEPTDSLDAQNLLCLELAINQLREVTAARNLQVIIVTHERKLARLADATLDLGGW